MEITITYKLIEDGIDHIVHFTPEEYFDPLQEGHDSYNVDSLSKYLFPIEYIAYVPHELISVILRITDGDSYYRREHFFWNNGLNETNYIISFNAQEKEIFEWLITTTVTLDADQNKVEESVRLYKNEYNIWVVAGHNYRTILPDLDKEEPVIYMDVHKGVLGLAYGIRKSDAFPVTARDFKA